MNDKLKDEYIINKGYRIFRLKLEEFGHLTEKELISKIHEILFN